MTHTERHSPLALAVLALLYEEPMHPYRMQQLLKSRGKGEVINVRQRASLYQAIERLQRAGLIRVRKTARDEKRPERTIYEPTEAGREAACAWLREMLATPAREFPEFPAALAFLPLLAPEDALLQLERRAGALAAELARIDALFDAAARAIPRLFLIEAEYQRAVLSAELEWVRQIIGDLQADRIDWTEEWLRATAAAAEDGRQIS